MWCWVSYFYLTKLQVLFSIVFQVFRFAFVGRYKTYTETVDVFFWNIVWNIVCQKSYDDTFLFQVVEMILWFCYLILFDNFRASLHFVFVAGAVGSFNDGIDANIVFFSAIIDLYDILVFGLGEFSSCSCWIGCVDD